MSKGLIYALTSSKKNINEKFKEFEISIKSFRRYNKNIPITVCTDFINSRLNEIKKFNVDIKIPIIREFDGNRSAKCQLLKLSPYDKTLIMDIDTIVVQNISHGFDFLDNRDIALSIAPNQEFEGITNFQNGLMFVKKNEKTNNLFNMWIDICLKDPTGPTRFSFSKLLLENSVNIYPLSYFWNFRIDLLKDFDFKESFLEKYILPKVKVFHSHLKRKVALDIIKKHKCYKDILEDDLK